MYNTIERSLSNNTACDCLPSPLYFTGRTSFVCLKDVIFNVEEIIKLLNEDTEKYDEEITKMLLNYFGSQTETSVTLEKTYFELEHITPSDYEGAVNSVGCVLGSGSAHGCCGNYSGCCWFSHTLCGIHDRLCTRCAYLLCLPGCVVD